MPLDQVDIDKMPKEDGKEMSFLDHLEELRWTILRSLVAIGICMVIPLIFKGPLIDNVVFAPSKGDFKGYELLCDFSEKVLKRDVLCFSNDLDIRARSLPENFTNYFKLSFLIGMILAFPIIFWQFWRFVSPAMYKKEKRLFKGVIASSWFFFMLGILFGYFIILPFSINFLENFQLSENIENIYDVNKYLSYVAMAILGSGIMFCLPVVIFLLSSIGLVGPKFLTKYRRHAIVIIVLVAALVTPPDVITQIAIGLPVYLLYELSILISYIVTKRRRKREAKEMLS